MEVLLDDIVNGVLNRVQHNVVPTLENATRQAKERIFAPRPPPKSTDLCYITDRLIVSSRPAPASQPTFNDIGRDRLPQQQQRRGLRRPRPNFSSSSKNTTEPPHPHPSKKNVDHTTASKAGPRHSEVLPDSEFDDTQRNIPCNDTAGVDRETKHDNTGEKSDDNDETMTTENPQEGGPDAAVAAPLREQVVEIEPDDKMQVEVEDETRAVVQNAQVQQNDEITPKDDNRHNGQTQSAENLKSESQNSSMPEIQNEESTPLTTGQGSPSTEDFSKESNDSQQQQQQDQEGRKVQASDNSPESPEQEAKSINPSMSAGTEQENIETMETDEGAKSENEQNASAAHSPREPPDSSKSIMPQSILKGKNELEDQTKLPDNNNSVATTREKTSSMETDDALNSNDANPDSPLEPCSNESTAPHSSSAKPNDNDNKEEDQTKLRNDSDSTGVAIKRKTTSTNQEALSSTTPPTDDDYDDDENDHNPPSTSVDVIQNVAQHELPSEPHPQPTAPLSKSSTYKNSPADITSYLDHRHGKSRYLAFSLTDEVPDDRSLLLFRRQIVQLGWWSPCTQRSETPSIPRMLQASYAIHAFLNLNPMNVALVYCNNGKTRTAIVVSCYMKFAGIVDHAYEGFLHFLTKKGIKNPEGTWKQLPPSLHLFFRQFDCTVDMGGFLNRKPLLLRAIALQGIPVEDMPCLDIWDSSQRHIYTSHPEIWDINDPVRRRMSNAFKDNKPYSQWADEEGFYKVNAILDGDFLLLCRFGGDFVEETTVHDPSKILFRYANTTGFLSGGCPYELPAHKVDLTRQYANHLTDDDFLVTLLFEADWERIDAENPASSIDKKKKSRVIETSKLSSESTACGERVWKCHETGACEEGLQIIFQRHSANPDGSDIRNFKLACRSKQVSKYKEHLLCLALQLSNFDYNEAERFVNETPSIEWWSETKNGQKSRPLKDDKAKDEGTSQKRLSNSLLHESGKSDSSEMILSLLSDVDVTSYIETPDDEQYQEMKELLRPQINVQTKEGNGQRGSNDMVASRGTFKISCTKDTGWMVPSILYPRPGDICSSFGSNLQSPAADTNQIPSRTSRSRPAIPLFRREKPVMIPPPAKRKCNDKTFRGNQWTVPRYNSQREAATEVLMSLRHTGVTLPGLLDLAESSREWTDVPMIVEEEHQEIDKEEAEEKDDAKLSETRDASMNREAKEMQEKKWKEATKAEAQEKEAKKQKEKVEKAEAESNSVEAKEQPADGEQALKDDPNYSKYFKMLKMGMVKEQVLHAMKRDEKDPSILDLDPNKSLKSQVPEEQKPTDGEVPLKDDPEYSKYFKMLKMGLPMGAVQNALTRDGKDPSIMDLDPNKSLKSQTQPAGGNDDGPPLKEDPEYQKYFKMLKMGLPVGAVKQALTKDGKDPGIMDLDPDKSLKSQTGSPDADDGPPLKEDPEYQKYFKMLKMGLPLGAVKQALTKDGKDPAIMDLDPEKSLKSQMGSSDADDGPPLKDDPEYSKYFKMLTMGLPVGAVKNALSRDGKDPAIMDLDPNKSVKSQLGGAEEKDTGIPLKDDPEYAKYFKMFAMGLPAGAVKNALSRDGKDPAIMDLDPTKSVAFQMKKKGDASKKPIKKKKRVRRKKIYWNPIDPKKLKEDSMWSIVRGSVVMDKLNYDPKEFEDLFTESADPKDKKKKKSGGDKSAKKLVQVIDGKRSMNGGIILARLKIDYSIIAGHVDKMNHGKFDATQLKALKEYLADQDERRGLMAYMEKGKSNPEMKDKLYSELSETEKYMWTMMEVKDAAAKFDALSFRTNFKTRFEDISAAIGTLNAACDQLRSSQKLRKLMAMILTVVNQINTGGEGNMEVGFTLDALLKLNEAKAFDKKTSVLHYVVKLVKKNDPELVAFDADLGSITAAESVILDGLNADVSSLNDELKGVHETVKKEADRLEQAGELQPMTLADLKEQRTVVKQVGSTTQYNQTDHLTGRTSMERFTVNAEVACEEASDSISGVKKKYAALVQYFDEDEQIATSDFFGTFRRFVVEWKKAVEQVEAIEKKEAKEKKKREKEEKKKREKAAKAGKSGSASGAGSKGKKHAQLPKLLKRSSKNEDGPSNPQMGGGIAAAAAAAAASKQEKKPPISGGGIAAAAAAAAASKKKQKPESPMAGGIAAAAAAAAASKKKKKPESPMAGGIAAAAAAAAASKKSKKPAIGGGGIAAAAAAAASKKLKKAVQSGVHGISVAGEATKVVSESVTKNVVSAIGGGGGGGIAAMAAAAAARKQKASPPKDDVTNKEDDSMSEVSKPRKVPKPEPSIEEGGIAAAAAAAASKKLKKPESPPPHESKIDGPVAAFSKNGEKNTDQTAEQVESTPLSQNGATENTTETKGEGEIHVPEQSRMNEKANEPIPDECHPMADNETKTPLSPGEEASTSTQRQVEADDGEGKFGFAAKAAAYRRRKKDGFETSPKSNSTKPNTLGSPAAMDSVPGIFVDDLITKNDSDGTKDKKDHEKSLVVPANTDDGKSSSTTGGLGAGLASKEEKESVGAQNIKSEHHGPGLASNLENKSPPRKRGPSLASFLERGLPQETRKEKPRQIYPTFDDSSIAMLAENLQKQPLDPRMSTTWTEGDTIPNWMSWANQAIKSSDTESVRGFETSRDLNDMNDYDDDSTIATLNDDFSVVSASTPKGISSFVSHDSSTDLKNVVTTLPLDQGVDQSRPVPPTTISASIRLPLDDQGVVSTPAVTPAKVAASILFSDDSTASTHDKTPAKSNIKRNSDQEDLVDMRLSFPMGDVGLDAGLSFADDVGLDDGLGGFGGDFGGDFGGEAYRYNSGDGADAGEGEESERRKWFPWAKK